MDLTYQLKGSGESRTVRIPFDPPLAGYEEVKPRLMNMKGEAEEALGMVRTLPFPLSCHSPQAHAPARTADPRAAGDRVFALEHVHDDRRGRHLPRVLHARGRVRACARVRVARRARQPRALVPPLVVAPVQLGHGRGVPQPRGALCRAFVQEAPDRARCWGEYYGLLRRDIGGQEADCAVVCRRNTL